jgi:phosphonoacetaldehyde hydrolase
MTISIDAVFFDWAGTMVDFGSRAPVLAMRSVFAGAGVEVSEAAVRAHMGKAKREHVLAMFDDQEVNARWQAVKGRLPSEADADLLMVELEPAMSREAAKASTLIPSAKEMFDDLIASGIKVGSTTGYTQTMMADVARLAGEQGYNPQTILCAGDTPQGRPAPFMLWQAMINLNVWPARACVAIDDAPVGIIAGREAGMWTVGLAGSGNELGLDEAAYFALKPYERYAHLRKSAHGFIEVQADVVIATIADLPQALSWIEAAILEGKKPGERPSVLALSVTG